MKKKLHICIAAAGVIFFVVGFWYAVVAAGLPYQDPTPDMLEQYNRDLQTGNILMIAGGIIELSEFIYWGVTGLRRFYKKCRQTNNNN